MCVRAHLFGFESMRLFSGGVSFDGLKMSARTFSGQNSYPPPPPPPGH